MCSDDMWTTLGHATQTVKCDWLLQRNSQSWTALQGPPGNVWMITEDGNLTSFLSEQELMDVLFPDDMGELYMPHQSTADVGTTTDHADVVVGRARWTNKQYCESINHVLEAVHPVEAITFEVCQFLQKPRFFEAIFQPWSLQNRIIGVWKDCMMQISDGEHFVAWELYCRIIFECWRVVYSNFGFLHEMKPYVMLYMSTKRHVEIAVDFWKKETKPNRRIDFQQFF